jgi:hypothetical protein
MYTPGGLEAAGYGFSKDCKQLLNFWLSWWGRACFCENKQAYFLLYWVPLLLSAISKCGTLMLVLLALVGLEFDFL